MSKTKYRLSLGKKVTAGIICVSVLLAGIAVVIGYSAYATTMDNHYKVIASNVAKTAATQMNAERIATYLDTLEKDAEYYKMRDILFDIKNSNGVLWLYVEKLAPDAVYAIMDADDDETAYQLGETYEIAEKSMPYIYRQENGIPPFISNSEYGWLVTSHEPIINSQGEVVALVGADISMDAVMTDRHMFLFILCAGMSAVMAISVAVVLFLTRKLITEPINRLADATGDFISGKKSGVSAISELNIKTGDEIENLSETIKIMERDINDYIINITSITAEKERIGAELSVATQIQASMLPCIFPPFPDRDEFDIFASMKPAKEVGGDFYDFFLIGDDRLGIVIADVSGKGVPAALFMVIAKTLIKNYAQAGAAPEEIFTRANDTLCENNEADMFVTAFMGILEIKTGRFVYVNAGHNYPLLCRNGKGYDWLKASPGFVLAGMEGMRYKQYELTLKEGDRLFLYTDGVTEAVNKSDDLFSDDRLCNVLNAGEAGSLSLGGLDYYIRNKINEFAAGAEQADDITILTLEYGKGA